MGKKNLRLKLQSITLINKVRTSQKTHCVNMTKPNRLFWKIVSACIENHRKHINTLRAQIVIFGILEGVAHRVIMAALQRELDDMV